LLQLGEDGCIAGLGPLQELLELFQLLGAEDVKGYGGGHVGASIRLHVCESLPGPGELWPTGRL